MDADWIRTPTAALVLVHWADARPAWLWSQDGETLLWRNDAARFFHGRIKKHGVKLAPDAVPIKGQIARLIRLGSMGRPSLSRIQFLAGERPISTTCTCTPLDLGQGSIGLLIVGVDPIEPELLEARDLAVPPSTDLFPRGSEILLVNEDGQITDGTSHALEHYAPVIESEGLPEAADGDGVEIAGESLRFTRFTASPHDAMLLLFERGNAADAAPRSIAKIRADEGEAASDEDTVAPVATEPSEPMLPLGLPPAEQADDEPVLAEEENWVEPIAPATDSDGTLSSLFDRLVDDETLYAPLTAGDEHFAGPPPEPVGEVLRASEPVADTETQPELVAPEQPEPVAPAEPDVIAALIDYADEEPEQAPTTWRVIGRGFAAADTTASQTEAQAPEATEPVALVAETVVEASAPTELASTEPAPAEPTSTAPDAEAVERVSRYNFDELSRILSDRVNQGTPTRSEEPEAEPAQPAHEGALINLTGETFILNRLPLGILVFRDQQVLFANRALTDLTGYESIESLRAAGLTAIFPSEETGGPVTRLVKRDGSLAAVSARLQSITWHGRPALMLSAAASETRIGHEAAVRTFAELAAEISDDGFIAADRAGIVTTVSLHGRIVLGLTEEEIVGRPLAAFVEPGQLGDLKTFLERPARFAETARPAILFSGASANVRLSLFAEGQAGIVTGYFALLRKLPAPLTTAAPPKSQAAEDVEPSMLRRVSQSVRRPLNAVIGFADLIRDSADAERTTEYAQDIKTAGTEIANLVDELDEYARLREGRYPAAPDDLDLASLLESCLARVRKQAGEARVLVRSAVSERLPRITADRASLTQGILNLLASAIDQTPVGGSVILSAQRDDDGAVIVNVRDGGETRRDLGERFVVFRDGTGKDGEALQPVRSSVGLALTRSLLAVNALKLSVDPLVGTGNMFSLLIPADLVRE